MKERKLKEEYRLETRLDTRTGKPKQIPVYMGDDYHLGGETDRRRLLSDCLVWLAALMICWFGYLMINSPSSRCIYVLPFASCASIPMLYAGIGAVNALRAPRKMTRLQQETGIARLMRSHLGCAIFLTLALVGDAVFLLLGGGRAELPGAALLALAAAAAWTGFARVKRICKGITVQPGRAAQEAAKKAAEADTQKE